MTSLETLFDEWTEEVRERFNQNGYVHYDFNKYFGGKASPLRIISIEGEKIIGVEDNRKGWKREKTFPQLWSQFEPLLRNKSVDELNPYSLHPFIGKAELWEEMGRVMFAEFIDFVRSRSQTPFRDISALTESITDHGLDLLIVNDHPLANKVLTDSVVGQTLQRRGQDSLRRLTLMNYQNRCALCDIADPRLLIASHIIPWAQMKEARGLLSNVICLCRSHDALFELGYWSLSNDLTVLLNDKVHSYHGTSVLMQDVAFRYPQHHPPSTEYLRSHRKEHGFD